MPGTMQNDLRTQRRTAQEYPPSTRAQPSGAPHTAYHDRGGVRRKIVRAPSALLPQSSDFPWALRSLRPPRSSRGDGGPWSGRSTTSDITSTSFGQLADYGLVAMHIIDVARSTRFPLTATPSASDARPHSTSASHHEHRLRRRPMSTLPDMTALEKNFNAAHGEYTTSKPLPPPHLLRLPASPVAPTTSLVSPHVLATELPLAAAPPSSTKATELLLKAALPTSLSPSGCDAATSATFTAPTCAMCPSPLHAGKDDHLVAPLRRRYALEFFEIHGGGAFGCQGLLCSSLADPQPPEASMGPLDGLNTPHIVGGMRLPP
ncbi:hypothetical protein EV122DRAFT_278803 [Schizophyllum commune]